MEASKQPAEVKPIDVQATPVAAPAGTPAAPAQSAGGRAASTLLRTVLYNGKGTTGALILIFFAMVAVFAPLISPGDPTNFVGRPHQAPSAEFNAQMLAPGFNLPNTINAMLARYALITGDLTTADAAAAGATAKCLLRDRSTSFRHRVRGGEGRPPSLAPRSHSQRRFCAARDQ